MNSPASPETERVPATRFELCPVVGVPDGFESQQTFICLLLPSAESMECLSPDAARNCALAPSGIFEWVIAGVVRLSSLDDTISLMKVARESELPFAKPLRRRQAEAPREWA